jgi:ElaB/YqjD/DUF883 family membrane-anchored ribosome-binding protein
MISQAQEKVQETAQQATSVAGDAIRGQVDTRAAKAASELQSIAVAMRRSGHSLRAEGNESSAKIVDTVSERMENVGSYLSQTSGDRLLQDVETFGRRQPWTLVGAGVALGFVASRFLKASSRTRYDRPQQPRRQMPVTAASPIPPAPAAPYTPPVADPVGGTAFPR